MKKVMYGLFIGLFLAMSLALSVGMVFIGPAQPAANEILAEAPALKTEDGAANWDVLSHTAAWIGDRFFLRNELIGLDRRLTASVLNTSGQSSVILGTDGWLYFTPTLANYTDTEGMTERELSNAAHNLSLMARYCEENGKQFLFVIAPNKNALYSDHMPSFGVKAEKTDAQRLHGLLKEKGVAYADLFGAFAAQNEVLYFAHDSHWNSKGAALGADVINSGFGRQSNYFGGDFSASEPHEGDLFAMLYPGSTDPEQNPVYGGKLQFAFTGRATKADAIVLETAGQGSGKLLAYRDSFGNLLYPYLADSFASATFSRSTAYDLTKEGEYVLVELVQRNLRYLITNIPVMPSPRGDICPAVSQGTLTVKTAKKGGLLQVTGTLPGEADRAYVVCDTGTFEAFLLEDNGFAANVPADSKAENIIYIIGETTQMYELTNGGN